MTSARLRASRHFPGERNACMADSKGATSSVLLRKSNCSFNVFKRRGSSVLLSEQMDIFTVQILNPIWPPFNDSIIAVNSNGKIKQVSFMFSVGHDLYFTPSLVLCNRLICPSRQIPLQLVETSLQTLLTDRCQWTLQWTLITFKERSSPGHCCSPLYCPSSKLARMDLSCHSRSGHDQPSLFEKSYWWTSRKSHNFAYYTKLLLLHYTSTLRR